MYAFGMAAKESGDYKSYSWDELSSCEEFVLLKHKYSFNSFILECIRCGFIGMPLPSIDDQVITFGKYTDKKFSEIPEHYIEWLSRQEWLDQHPMLCMFVRQSLATKEKPLSKEETKRRIREILQLNQ